MTSKYLGHYEFCNRIVELVDESWVTDTTSFRSTRYYALVQGRIKVEALQDSCGIIHSLHIGYLARVDHLGSERAERLAFNELREEIGRLYEEGE